MYRACYGLLPSELGSPWADVLHNKMNFKYSTRAAHLVVTLNLEATLKKWNSFLGKSFPGRWVILN